MAIAHSNLGLVALYEHDRDEAWSHFRQALELGRAPKSKPQLAESLRGAAAVAAIDAEHERAACLWGAADTISATVSARLSAPDQFVVETYLEPTRAELEAETFESACQRGARMPLEEAVAYALRESD